MTTSVDTVFAYRAYLMEHAVELSEAPGTISTIGRELDIARSASRWIVVAKHRSVL